MNDGRRREIALMVVKQMVLDRGLPPAEQLKRDIENLAKKTDLSTEELMQFCQPLMHDYVKQAFGADNVSLTIKRTVRHNELVHQTAEPW